MFCLLQLPTLTEIILVISENSLRTKESNYRSVSSVTWTSLLMSWRRAGEGTREENGQGQTGPSLQRKTWGQHRHFCLPHLHYKSLACNPGCTGTKAPSRPISKAPTSNLGMVLPITYQAHPLTPTIVSTGEYLLHVPHSVSNRPLIVTDLKFTV